MCMEQNVLYEDQNCRSPKTLKFAKEHLDILNVSELPWQHCVCDEKVNAYQHQNIQ